MSETFRAICLRPTSIWPMTLVGLRGGTPEVAVKNRIYDFVGETTVNGEPMFVLPRTRFGRSYGVLAVNFRRIVSKPTDIGFFHEILQTETRRMRGDAA